jgi:hypothetical protein
VNERVDLAVTDVTAGRVLVRPVRRQHESAWISQQLKLDHTVLALLRKANIAAVLVTSGLKQHRQVGSRDIARQERLGLCTAGMVRHLIYVKGRLARQGDGV